MYKALKQLVLRILKVPPEPQDPMGKDEGSLLVFRAAPNYLRYRYVVWTIGHTFTVFFAFAGLIIFEFAISPNIVPENMRWLGHLLTVLAVIGFLMVILQTIFSLIMVQLDYEMRWYKVTDRSLRIREGVWAVREMTMTFANIQNISITQGPIQRMLNIADLKVQTAGGGAAVANEQQSQQMGFNMHTGYFRGVSNAHEIRDLMRDRLKRLRDSGLGDTDETRTEIEEPSSEDSAPTRLLGDGAFAEALRGLRDETRALRSAAESVARP